MDNQYVNEEEKNTFFRKFASKALENRNLSLTNIFTEKFHRFLICDFSSDLTESDESCLKMRPVMTGNGLCHSFNSLSVNEIYQESFFTSIWNSTFGGKNDSILEYPILWGPPRPLYIMVQSFEPSPARDGKNFWLSFTNEFDPFDVIQQSFEILPGYQHTYRVIPSQMSTLERFDKLNLRDRGCQLKSETDQLSLLKMYSKSGCEFECAIKATLNACKCLPWSAPRNRKSIKTCDIFGNFCFKKTFNFPETYKNCQCLEECQSTTYSISESSRPLPMETDCTKIKIMEKFFRYAHENFKLFFLFEYLFFGNPPEFNDFFALCNHLYQNHTSIIKIELGTKSIIRSVHDVKTTFEYQLSAIGKSQNFDL